MAFYSFFPGLVRLDRKKQADQVKAKSVFIHPDHTLRTESSDIAVVELSRALTISNTVKPICLPYKEPDLDLGLNEVFAAGWGTNAVQANLQDNPPKHKSCMTTQFGSVAFKACIFGKANEVCTVYRYSTRARVNYCYIFGFRAVTRRRTPRKTLAARPS